MYAVVESGGQQFKVKAGDLLKVDKLAGNVGDKVELDKVLLIQDDKNVKVGTPYLTGAKVIGEIVTQGRDEKIVVYRYKRRKGFQRKRGHHQLFTAVKIAKIVG